MMPTGLIHACSGDAFFLTDHFDRVDGRRLHVQTVAALLDVDFCSATVDYAELLKLVRVLTRDQRAVEQMARRMVFNIRAQNREDHLKNFAFIMSPDRAWRLAPAYYLSFSSGPGGEHTLTVAGEGRHPGAAQIRAVCVQSGIKRARIAEISPKWRRHCWTAPPCGGSLSPVRACQADCGDNKGRANLLNDTASSTWRCERDRPPPLARERPVQRRPSVFPPQETVS